MLKKIIPLIFCLAFLFCPDEGNAGPAISSLVESRAMTRVPDGNWASARRRAVDRAMRQAVISRISRLLKKEGKIYAKYKKKLTSILKRSLSYVQSYQVLEELKNQEQQSLTVRLRVGLFNAELANALYNLGVRSKKGITDLRIALLIGEKNLGQDGRLLPFDQFNPISETLLQRMFKEGNIRVLNRKAVFEIVDRESLKKAIKGDVKAAIAVGVQCGVQGVVMGTTISRQLPPNPGDPTMAAVQANISLKLIRVDQGAVVGAKSEFATEFATDPEDAELKALNKAASRLSEFFEKQIKKL